MEVTIIDYGMGNIGSVANMFKRAGASTSVTSDASGIASSGKLVLPGVGSFDGGMSQLRKLGLIEPLRRRVLADKVPILGICLGAQLFFPGSEEGREQGLGWIAGRVSRFRFDGADGSGGAGGKLRVPHMGWNTVSPKKPSPIFNDSPGELRFYFVHAYYMICGDPSDEVSVTNHGLVFTSAIQRGNILGVQFHPEKSHRFGLKLFKNFMEAP